MRRQLIAAYRHRKDQTCPSSSIGSSTSEQNADAKISELDPLVHFVLVGVRAGQSPHPLIDIEYIREQVPHIMTPDPTVASLWSVLSNDLADPSPYFSCTYYKSQLNDTIPIEGLLKHFLEQGLEDGLKPHQLVDPVWYSNQIRDCPDALSGLRHFVSQGDRDGRPPSPNFDSQHYLRSNPDVAAARFPALRHYLTRGRQEGRSYCPLALRSAMDKNQHIDAPSSSGKIAVELLMADETIWRDARTLNYIMGSEAWSRLDEIEREAQLNGDHAIGRRTQLTKEAFRLLPLAWSGKLTDVALLRYLVSRGYGGPTDG